MAFGRLIVGAVVGAAIGAAIWVLIQFVTESEFGWLAIVVGVLAGLFAKGAAGQAKLGYARGAVPAVATLLFIIVVHYALLVLLQTTGGPRKQSPLVDADSGAKTAESGTDNATNTGGPDLSAELTRGSPDGVAIRGPRRAKDPFSLETFIFVGVAAFAAYVLGGSDPIDTEVPSEEPEIAEPMADEAAEPTEEPPETEGET